MSNKPKILHGSQSQRHSKQIEVLEYILDHWDYFHHAIRYGVINQISAHGSIQRQHTGSLAKRIKGVFKNALHCARNHDEENN